MSRCVPVWFDWAGVYSGGGAVLSSGMRPSTQLERHLQVPCLTSSDLGMLSLSCASHTVKQNLVCTVKSSLKAQPKHSYFSSLFLQIYFLKGQRSGIKRTLMAFCIYSTTLWRPVRWPHQWWWNEHHWTTENNKPMWLWMSLTSLPLAWQVLKGLQTLRNQWGAKFCCFCNHRTQCETENSLWFYCQTTSRGGR